MALKENALNIYNYVVAHDGEDFTANDIAEDLGLSPRQVNGSLTGAFTKKGLMERVETEIELEDGTHKKVKFIKLTDLGRAFDPDAQE